MIHEDKQRMMLWLKNQINKAEKRIAKNMDAKIELAVIEQRRRLHDIIQKVMER